MFCSGWPKVRCGPASDAGLLVEHVTAHAADRSHNLFAGFRVAARRALHLGLVLLAVCEQIGDGRVDLDLVPDRILRRAGIRVVPDARHPGRRLDGLRVADPGLHPIRRQLRVDPGENGPGLPEIFEPARLVAGVAAGALVRRVGDVERSRPSGRTPPACGTWRTRLRSCPSAASGSPTDAALPSRIPLPTSLSAPRSPACALHRGS